MKIKQAELTALKIILPIAIFVVVLVRYDTLKNLDVRALIEAAPSVWAAAGIVLGVYAVKAVVFVIPASLVYISVGMAFPTPAAVALNCAGIALEITISYLLGRFLGGEKVDKFLRGKKGYATLEKLKSRGRFAFIFLLRFASFPIDFGSLFFGASDFAFPSYFLMSLCGILPRVIVLTILGYGIYELIPMKYILIAVLCAVPIVLIAFAVSAVRKKKCAQTDGAERNDPE
ncbi:MAG: VTT domain-containing protein [Clostridia bacterium]|nr:VTT domain-containing protein [Clostridia bacterium]